MHRAGPDGALGRIGCGRLAFYSIAIGIGLELCEAACAAKIMMFAAVRRNVRRGGRVDRHAADCIGPAPAAFFRALMVVHRRRSRTCLMLHDAQAVQTPPFSFPDVVFQAGLLFCTLLFTFMTCGTPLGSLYP